MFLLAFGDFCCAAGPVLKATASFNAADSYGDLEAGLDIC